MMKVTQKTLGEISEERVEQTGPCGKEFTYVDIGSIELDTKRIIEPKVLLTSKAPSRAKQVLKRGDVLVSMTRPNRNAVALVPTELDGAIGSTGFHVLRAKDAVPGFLFYAVQTNDFIDALCEKVQGALYPAVRPRDVSSFKTFLPTSLTEQRRIVAEIEKQFTRLEAGVTALRRVQANLKRYRAAVLKAACEGRLVPTEAELDKTGNRKTRFESGEALLARIRKVKAEKIRSGEMRKPRTIDEAFLTEPNQTVPEGWALGRVEDFGAPEDNAVVDGPFGSNLKLSDYTPDGKYPVITITNIDEGFDLASLRKVTEEKFQEVKRSAVRAGDILVAKIGSSFGKTGIYPSHMPVGIIPANLLKITPAAAMNWKYLFYHLHSLTFKGHLDTIVQYTAQPAFNVSKFKLLPVPVPPLAEQTRIVAEVERRLSVVDELEAVVSANLQRATRLRQSILQKAFAGELCA